jgi:TPR repeat protein
MRRPLAPHLALLALAGLAAAGAARAEAPAADSPEARCARGFASACRDLGRAHLLDEGASGDDRLAVAYLTKACEIGDAAGCADLGVLSAIGRGVSQDDARAVALSRRACGGGSALGCANLAVLGLGGAAGAPQAPDGRREAAARVVRTFRTACEAGAPEGCLDLGTALEADLLVAGDLAGAARALRRACDAGLGVACYRLGLLATRSPGSVGGPPQPLHAAACRAAVAPACDLAGLPLPPPGPRTPTPRLVDEPRSYALGIPGAGGFHPTDLSAAPRAARRSRDEVRRPPAPLLAALPPPLAARLGLRPPARPAEPPDAAVELLLDLRRQQLATCYEAPRRSPGAGAEVLVAFLVEADGRTGEVRAAAEPADPELEACAAEVVSGWELPLAEGGLGGPYLVRRAFLPAPAGAAPELTPPGGLRPALRQPGCLERRLRVPPEYRGAVGEVAVKLAVDAAGAPALLHAVTPAPEPLVAAIEEAARGCEWSPGADASGRKATFWLTVSVRLDGR